MSIALAVVTDAEAKTNRSRLARIGRDSGIVFLGNILDKLFGFAFTVGIAKLYGLRVFGLFLLGLTICQLGSLIFNLGFGNGLIRYVALYKKETPKLKGIIWTAGVLSVSLGVLLGLGLFLAAQPLVERFFANKARLVVVLQWLALTVPLSALSGIWVRTLVGLKHFKAQTYVRSVIEPGTKVGMALLLFLAGFKLEGLILAYVISTVAATVAAYYYYTATLRSRLKGVKPIFQFREFINYCWPLVLRNFISKATRRADVLLLGMFRNPLEITLYMFTLRMATLNTLIADAFEKAYSPHVPRLHAEGRLDELRHAFQTITKWTMLLSIPIFALLIVFPGVVIPVLGEQFMPAATALSVVAAAVCFSYAVGPSETALIMAGRPKVSLVIRIIGGLVTLGLNIWLVPQFGLIGAAWGFTGSVFVSNILAASIAYFDMNLHPVQRGYLKVLAAGALAIGVALALHPFLPANKYLALLALGLGYLVAYGGMLWLLGLDEEDKELARQSQLRLKALAHRQPVTSTPDMDVSRQ
ncbi:MAG: flippase [Acidobacteriota bacterium]|nr:flippase [Blastocatellia bacterium]MDW8239721.1 flippase [Acidobacteriota bacterium]